MGIKGSFSRLPTASTKLSGSARPKIRRERISAGDSDEQVVAFLTDRYGEYVLLTPRATGANLLLWLAGPALLLVGAGIGFAYVRGRRGAAGREAEALSAEEARRLKEILGD